VAKFLAIVAHNIREVVFIVTFVSIVAAPAAAVAAAGRALTRYVTLLATVVARLGRPCPLGLLLRAVAGDVPCTKSHQAKQVDHKDMRLCNGDRNALDNK
jgi:hypothetical protein